MATQTDWRSEPSTWIAIVVALLLWASAFAGIRAGLRSYGPGEVALLRFGTASIALALYAVAIRMRLPDRRDIPVVVMAGFLGITVYHVTLNFGERTVASGAAALIISASPIFTSLLSSRFLGERITRWGWTGIIISFVGVAMISLGEGGGLSLNTDALLILASAVATSLYFIVSKPPLRRYSGLEFTSYAIWAGTVPLLAFAPSLFAQTRTAASADTLAVVYLGIFPGAIAYVLWAHALSRMPASSLSAFLYFQPVNAAIIAWFWLGEVPALLTVVGGAVSIAGVVLLNSRGADRRLAGSAKVPEVQRAVPGGNAD